MATSKNTICLWYERDAQEAARFYAATFPNSKVGAVSRIQAPFWQSGRRSDSRVHRLRRALRRPQRRAALFKQSEAFWFQIATDDQAETDRYWNAIVGNGGAESACGWCKDRDDRDLWQITPRVLTDALAEGGDVAKRAFDAMMQMGKIDVAKIEAARKG